MATSMSMSVYSGYPTETSMRVNVSFSVTYEGSYKTYFELYDDWGDLVESAFGTTYAMSANSSKSGIYKTFSGLDPGTDYYIVGSLWNASTNQRLSISEPVVYFTTKSTSFTVNFCYGSTKKAVTSSGGSATPPSPSLSGYTLVGWAEDTNTVYVDYDPTEEITYACTLYAVFRKNTYSTFYYGTYGSLSKNYRYVWRVQSGTTSSKYVMTNSSSISSNILTSVPSFDSNTTVLNLNDWEGVGWENSTTATSSYDLDAGESLTSSQISSLSSSYYAIYSRPVTYTYNANGGSGTTSKSTGYAYYNCGKSAVIGNCLGASISIRSCGFSGPSGKSFKSWNTNSSGTGTAWSPGETITTVYDGTLYAIWSAAIIIINYYDGDTSVTDRSESPLVLRGGLRSDSGWEFIGWSQHTSTYTDPLFPEGEKATADSDATLDLYAVYKKDTIINCYFILGTTGEMDNNPRTKTQYRCNTSKTASSTNFYNVITLPGFSGENSTITTASPNREWDAIGWRQDRTAASATYSGGQSVASNLITANLYAVYSNNCTVTYNSNGGSGSMTAITAKAYYSASYAYTTPEIPINSCTFTPPTGKMFSHWNTAANGSGATYSEYIVTNYSITLYAIWRESRPNNWSWTTNVSKGVEMRCTGSGTNVVVKPLTASEWLDFADRIKEFYAYEGLTVDSTYWYRTINGVSSGSPMTATQVNAARYLINQLSPPTAVPAAVSSGSTITAAFINGLKNSLNSIK